MKELTSFRELLIIIELIKARVSDCKASMSLQHHTLGPESLLISFIISMLNKCSDFLQFIKFLATKKNKSPVPFLFCIATVFGGAII